MSVFGTIVDGEQVQLAVKATLEAWLPAYLEEMERQTGRDPGSLPAVRGWAQSVDFDDATLVGQLPLVVIVVPGLLTNPTRKGDGKHDVLWGVGVGVVCTARDQESANSLSKVYAAAIRALLLQHQSLGGKASGVSWLDERYDDARGLGVDDARTIAAGQVHLAVGWDDVVDSRTGPTTLPAPAEWPLVQQADVTVTTKEA